MLLVRILEMRNGVKNQLPSNFGSGKHIVANRNVHDIHSTSMLIIIANLYQLRSFGELIH